jgi:hypothetical protein
VIRGPGEYPSDDRPLVDPHVHQNTFPMERGLKSGSPIIRQFFNISARGANCVFFGISVSGLHQASQACRREWPLPFAPPRQRRCARDERCGGRRDCVHGVVFRSTLSCSKQPLVFVPRRVPDHVRQSRRFPPVVRRWPQFSRSAPTLAPDGFGRRSIHRLS